MPAKKEPEVELNADPAPVADATIAQAPAAGISIAAKPGVTEYIAAPQHGSHKLTVKTN